MPIIDYSEVQATRVQIAAPEDCAPYLDTESVSWIDVQGLGSEDTWRRLGQVFHLHPLTLEDVVNVPQRPKVEDYEDQLVLIARSGYWGILLSTLVRRVPLPPSKKSLL